MVTSTESAEDETPERHVPWEESKKAKQNRTVVIETEQGRKREVPAAWVQKSGKKDDESDEPERKTPWG